MPRIPVDLIYMQMAYQIAKLSYAKRRRVGCIIVKDTQVISTGYNGTPHGFDNNCEEEQVREIENENHKKVLEEKGYACDDTCCSKLDILSSALALALGSTAISSSDCDPSEIFPD